MPSTDTITGWTTFVANTTIKSAEVLANFAIFRGHMIPFSPSAVAATTGTYDLGSSTYRWKNVWGILRPQVDSTSGSMTLTTAHDVVLMDSSAATITATLPTAVSNNGLQYTIRNIGTGGRSVFLDGNGSETIDATVTMNLIDGETAHIIAQGGSWYSI